jgi:hypothetical protein
MTATSLAWGPRAQLLAGGALGVVDAQQITDRAERNGARRAAWPCRIFAVHRPTSVALVAALRRRSTTDRRDADPVHPHQRPPIRLEFKATAKMLAVVMRASAGRCRTCVGRGRWMTRKANALFGALLRCNRVECEHAVVLVNRAHLAHLVAFTCTVSAALGLNPRRKTTLSPNA